MKPHTLLNWIVSRFSRLHAGIRKCVGSTKRNTPENGFKKMGFCWPHSLLSCSWTPDSWKNEFLKLSGLVAACCCQHHCLRYIDSWTFMNQCNVGSGADSNKLRLVSQRMSHGNVVYTIVFNRLSCVKKWQRNQQKWWFTFKISAMQLRAVTETER